MKKLIIIALLVLISTSVVFALTPKRKDKPSDYNIGIKYEQALKSDKPSILLFYTDWCTYCQRFMPIYKEIGDTYKDRYNLVMVNVEKNEDLAIQYSIDGYPNVFIIDPSIDNLVHLNSGIYASKNLLEKELDRYLRIRARIK